MERHTQKKQQYYKLLTGEISSIPFWGVKVHHSKPPEPIYSQKKKKNTPQHFFSYDFLIRWLFCMFLKMLSAPGMWSKPSIFGSLNFDSLKSFMRFFEMVCLGGEKQERDKLR